MLNIKDKDFHAKYVEYQTLVESLKDELKKINTVEVHFSLDFRFRKADDNADLYNDICAAIIIMTNMLKDMYSTIGDCTELCDDLIEIPMQGQKESFNVSVATGIALYALST